MPVRLLLGLLGEVPPEVPDLPGQGDEGPASTSVPQSASTTGGVADTGFCPPDPTVAAGPNNVLVAVNASVASYSKAAEG